MKSLERNILILALIAVVLVAGLYAYKFFGASLSASQSDWALLGDYFGGVLSPILSFLLILLIINEAVESRRNFLESKQLQLDSQKQINQQIELLRPKPELVYYLAASGSYVSAIIENVGNATAYKVNVSFEFEKDTDRWTNEVYARLKSLPYIPPKYKNGLFVSHISASHEVMDMPAHKATIKYFTVPAPTENDVIQEKTYVVDDNMLRAIYSEDTITESLQDIAKELRSLQRKKS